MLLRSGENILLYSVIQPHDSVKTSFVNKNTILIAPKHFLRGILVRVATRVNPQIESLPNEEVKLYVGQSFSTKKKKQFIDRYWI